ncbi:hypothetical protein [Candidatus Contendibacter odensensis]|uniref:Uncharacterized protein n=1 Tax=Candidatus Contendobacter odensis Run_B_J11 TaxID=1400861 RepID=A0A7U7J3J3_9GAMM|nr:hypothetical protein [Candidatus Contendobacter odensis]CDH44654.1 conserved membrane hypothetical protein [Candidatus Contendobacter odensis Run_B_J11]
MEWVILGVLVLAWLISPIILLIALIIARRQLHDLRQQPVGRRPDRRLEQIAPIPPAPMLSGNHRYAPADLENLLLLQLELQRLRESDAVTGKRFQQLADHLNRLWIQHLREGGAQPENSIWQQRRTVAWNLLAQGSDTPLGLPPWQPAAPESPPIPMIAAALQSLPRFSLVAKTDHFDAPCNPPLPPGDSTEPPMSLPPFAIEAVETAPSAKRTNQGSRWEEPIPVTEDDWRPAVPSPLEKALQVLSGWPKLIAPFLAQNIGWFIGGFCFMAGALFLIANTSGFINALVVFASLSSATVFLIWAGYQFRRNRPELVVASSVLLTLGMLLAPLDLVVAIRLVSTSSGDGLLLIVSLSIGVVTLVAFAWAATLTSGLMDRVLMGRYPQLLTALAAVQLAAPLAVVVPDWRGLAVLHLVLLGLLGYALRTFTGEWLQRLFIDERLTTYYAAGLLVYTAVVSFVHLTWIWPEPLPVGYAGPFLMALCGLLFPVDAALKDWVNKYAFLSRFSFTLYGLSVVAIAIAVQTTPTVIVTLALGALLYGWVTWRYRTLPPLYLLLVCVAGLYGFGILNTLPPAWHGLASLPGLLALLGLCRWTRSRSRAIALQCLTVFGVLLVGLTTWSLLSTPPGWIGFATAALAALLSYGAVRLALTLPDADPRWAYGDGVVTAFALAAVGYAPGWLPFSWELRSAFGALALATLWVALGLHDRRQSPISRTVFIAGALLNIALALALGGIVLWMVLPGRVEPILLLALAGGLLLWLSLGLHQQTLFYGVLAGAGGIGVLIKRGYFPGPSSGLGEFALVMGLWWLLWRLAWRLRIGAALQFEIASEDRLEARSPSDLIRAPLEQAMALLWVVGLAHLSLRLLEGGLAWHWPLTTALAVVSGLLLIGHFHWFRWVALPMLLGLAGLLAGLERVGLTLPWLGAVAVLYALLVWRFAIALLAKPPVWRLAQVMSFTVPGGAGGAQQVEESLHSCALVIAVATVAACPTLVLLGMPTPEGLPALMTSLLLFTLTGWHYRSSPHAYAALMTLTIGIWLTGLWLSPNALLGAGQPLSNALLSLVMALAAVGLEAERAVPLTYWRIPLQRMSGLLYLLALVGAGLGFLTTDPRLPGLLALLCIALFPVARPLPHAAQWRGLGLALLLSSLIWTLALRLGFDLRDSAGIAMVWGYALWLGGNLLLPRWNARWPDWAVSATFWPLLGLISVLAGGTVGWMTWERSPAAALAGLSLYLFLLLRNTAWPGMAWLAVATLTASGLLAVIGIPPASSPPFSNGRLGEWVIALIWLNWLFLLIPRWRRYGVMVAQWLDWRQSELEAPLFWTPFVALILLLAQLLMLELALLWAWMPATHLTGSLTVSAVLLAATAGHAFNRHPEKLSAQVLLLALGAAVVAVLLDLAVPLIWLPLTVVIWNGALLLAWRYGLRRSELWDAALDLWLLFLPAVSVILLFIVPDFSGTAVTVTLFALAIVTVAQGGWRNEPFWLKAGFFLALTGSYTIWLVGTTGFAWIPLIGVAPWYAVQTVVLMLAFTLIRQRLMLWLSTADPEIHGDRFNGWYEVETVISGLIPKLLLFSGFWLALHGYAVLAYQAGWGASPWHFGIAADPLAAGAALLMLAGLTLTRAWRRPDEPNWIYATALLLGVLAGYGRLILLGLTPFTVGDTAALMAAGYVAFLLHQFTGAKPLYRLALLLPVLALATVPWQLASPWAGGTLLATAVLYLSLAGTMRNPLPLYLGVLALNGAIYLWAPVWAGRYGLWQFTIVPAAVSVLALLHLHRHELRPKVLNGARLAALSLLYAGAGLDVFLRPELGVFVLALGLAFIGIIFGIALRIRAFLYAGVAFLLLNVIGQLLRFYPEQNLSRALILLGLGTAITLGMVIFNLKREAILQRIRLVRADLAAWE